MREGFDLQEYVTKGVEHVVADALKATLKNPRESAFMLKFASASRKASKKRAKAEKEGEHIPPFMMASITSSCNLHCAGCYSRCVGATEDTEPEEQLTADEWRKVFNESDELGLSFIILLGGEPLLRKDVITQAAEVPDILFPIITNGIFISEEYMDLFDAHRNLIPVISIEGDREITDKRRGDGVYDRVMDNMASLRERDLVFGASVTVTTENLEKVMSDDFVRGLSELGCKLIFYVEYVPTTEETAHLAPGDEEREYLMKELARLRQIRQDIVLVAFPGDEKSSGGCIAAGRGFFHINSHGGAEPCPFSPYSDINVKDASVREALHSGLFMSLRDEGVLMDDHKGGCVLFEKKEQVEGLATAGALS